MTRKVALNRLRSIQLHHVTHAGPSEGDRYMVCIIKCHRQKKTRDKDIGGVAVETQWMFSLKFINTSNYYKYNLPLFFYLSSLSVLFCSMSNKISTREFQK